METVNRCHRYHHYSIFDPPRIYIFIFILYIAAAPDCALIIEKLIITYIPSIIHCRKVAHIIIVKSNLNV